MDASSARRIVMGFDGSYASIAALFSLVGDRGEINGINP